MNKIVDMSHELILHRHLNGVQLSTPGHCIAGVSMAEIMTRQISVFFKKQDYTLAGANNHQLECLQLASAKDLIGKSIAAITQDAESIDKIHLNNEKVIETQRTLFFDENTALEGGINVHAMSVKMPWYDANNQLLGIFGFACVNQTPLQLSNTLEFANTLNDFFTSDQAKPQHISALKQIRQTYSPRELDIIQLVLRGKTMRQCACILNISHRTVEHYFSNIKDKAGVQTRSELVEKLIALGCHIS